MADGLEKGAEAEPAPRTGLEESISFGRFTGELLSWERWSSFSQNKYMEEAEKCSTPGSVAEKKAYFEAHYKRIAVRKAELLEQEQQPEADALRSNGHNFENTVGNRLSSEFTDVELGTLDVENGSESESTHNNFNDVKSNANADELKENVMVIEGECPLDHGSSTEFKDIPADLELDKSGVDASVEEERFFMETKIAIEEPPQFEKKIESVQARKPEEFVKQKSPSKQPLKRTPVPPKERNLATTKKQSEVPTSKLQNTAVRRASRPPSTSPVSSTTKVSTRKDSSSLPRRKNASVTENKQQNHTLHASLVINSENGSDTTATATSRRSLIMEKMGDKEIVRRAFKTFQNRINPSNASADAKFSMPQQASANGKHENSPAAMVHGKRNEGKPAEKANAQRRPVDAQASSVLIGPSKASGASKPVSRTESSSSSLRSVERAEKRRESLVKLEEKTNALEMERTHLRSKSKEMKDAEKKKLQPSLDLKVNPIPVSYREYGVSKNFVNKEGTRNGSSRHLGSNRRQERVPHPPQS